MTDDDSTPQRLDAEGIACTLTESEAERRRERVADELIPHVETVEKREDEVAFAVADGDEPLAALLAFVRREHECCSFARFRLDVTPADEPNRLSVTGEGVDGMFERGVKPLLAERAPDLLA